MDWRKFVSQINLSTALKTGVLFFLFLAVLVLALDIYAFYSAFLYSPPQPPVSQSGETARTAADFEEIIKLLDERQKRFDEILQTE